MLMHMAHSHLLAHLKLFDGSGVCADDLCTLSPQLLDHTCLPLQCLHLILEGFGL